MQKNKGKSIYVPMGSKVPLTNGTVSLEDKHMEIGGPSRFGTNNLIAVQDEAFGAVHLVNNAFDNIDLHY